MRAVFIGASGLAVMTARVLLRRGHEVVIIEQDKGIIESLSTELDCGFLNGDGSRPALLREADPPHSDFLFCVTGNDQANIIASLVGRSLGFPRVVTRIEDPSFEHICLELGLEDTIIPARTMGRYLADMAEGHNLLEMSAMIKGDARILSFVAKEKQAGKLADLSLPPGARVAWYYRGTEFLLPEPDGTIKPDDEVILITHRKHLDELQELLRDGGE